MAMYLVAAKERTLKVAGSQKITEEIVIHKEKLQLRRRKKPREVRRRNYLSQKSDDDNRLSYI